jgi:hypothetical protein
MNGKAGDDAAGDRAARVLSESRAAAAAVALAGAWTASLRDARALAAGRAVVQAAGALPRSERRLCTLLLIASAFAGHVIMTSMLPLQSRPTVWLTAIALLAAILAASAAIARSR